MKDHQTITIKHGFRFGFALAAGMAAFKIVDRQIDRAIIKYASRHDIDILNWSADERQDFVDRIVNRINKRLHGQILHCGEITSEGYTCARPRLHKGDHK